jgi:hypothetical protein
MLIRALMNGWQLPWKLPGGIAVLVTLLPIVLVIDAVSKFGRYSHWKIDLGVWVLFSVVVVTGYFLLPVAALCLSCLAWTITFFHGIKRMLVVGLALLGVFSAVFGSFIWFQWTALGNVARFLHV